MASEPGWKPLVAEESSIIEELKGVKCSRHNCPVGEEVHNLRVSKITNGGEYKEVFGAGSKIYTPSFSLICLSFEPLSSAELRIGVIASKKVGKAVQRNKCRRLLKALSTEVFSKNEYPKSLKLVMIAKLPLLKRKYELIKREAKFCVHKLREMYETK